MYIATNASNLLTAAGIGRRSSIHSRIRPLNRNWIRPEMAAVT